MSPNDNNESDDFISTDKLMQIPPLRDGRNGNNTFNQPLDTDYVTVKDDNPIISAEQDVFSEPLNPDPYNQPMVQIEYFEPMPISSLPEVIRQNVLMAPVPNEHEMLIREAIRPPSPLDPHRRFVGNAITLLECFFHFDGLHPKFGRDSVLYMMRAACELLPEHPGPASLQQHVGRILDTLQEGRLAFLRLNEDWFDWRDGNHYVRKLVRLVDRYISCQPELPREAVERWFKDLEYVSCKSEEPRQVGEPWYKDLEHKYLWSE